MGENHKLILKTPPSPFLKICDPFIKQQIYIFTVSKFQTPPKVKDNVGTRQVKTGAPTTSLFQSFRKSPREIQPTEAEQLTVSK